MAQSVAAPQRPPRNGNGAPLSRMSLSALVKGKQARPLRITMFGVEGVGKSTFGASAPAPIFLGAEDGTAHLDVERFPMPATWAEAIEAVRVLETEPHAYKTLVVDTLDWLEPMLWRHVCERDGEPSIESYGYGKGYVAALDEWRLFLAALERMRDRRGMHVLFLAHSWIKPFKNPEGEDYDRFELKLHAKAAGLIKEWSDVVLFANWETIAVADKRTKRVKGVSTGARLLYTTRTAAYDAKNRHDLPESLPLSWEDFAAALEAHAPAPLDALRAEVERKAKEVGGDVEKKALETLAASKTDAAKLAKLNDRLNAKLGELAERSK